MAHVYAEKREQAAPGEQERWRCRECQREWLYAQVFGPGWVAIDWATSPLKDNCPACGSPEIERVRFHGIFDSATDAAEIGRLMAVASADQLLAEAERRITRPSIHEVSDPPVTLMEGARPPMDESWPPEWAR